MGFTSLPYRHPPGPVVSRHCGGSWCQKGGWFRWCGGWSTHFPNQKPNNLRRENEIWYIVRKNWSTGKVCWRHCQIKQNLLPHRNFANHPSHQLQNQSTTSLSVGQCAIDLGLQHRNEMLWFQIHNEMIIQDLASTASQRCSSVLYFFQAKLQVTIPFIG